MRELETLNRELAAALRGCLDLIQHIRPKADHHGEVIAARVVLSKLQDAGAA